MILDLVQHIAAKRLVLASASPRRVELLQRLGLKFDVVPSTFPENLDKSGFASAAAYAEENARRKALEVFERLSALAPPSDQAGAGDRDRAPDIIIASDSVVEAEGRIMEKPADASEATAMLKMLSGSVHRVHSGVCIIVTGPESSTMKPPPSPSSTGTLTATTLAGSSVTIRTFAESTEVRFAPLSDAIIAAYIATGEPFDKAGGYGIQGVAGSFVTGITGCYYNVMGFPLHRVCAELRDLITTGTTITGAPAADDGAREGEAAVKT